MDSASASAATDRYRLAATDYLNTYYGRLAWKRLSERNEASVTPGVRRAVVPPPPAPPTADRITRLIELELYHPALAELQHAQRIYGDSAPLQATIAFVQHRIGNLRLGINAMKRAYPQYMTAGGEEPADRDSAGHLPDGLLADDPESRARARSRSVPRRRADRSGIHVRRGHRVVGERHRPDADDAGDGRQYARKIGIKPFSPARLTEPEINARIGTRYFADLIRMFGGGAHYALASYNAGENRIARWRKEKPDLEQDEFIDDIPFPETQNYVKRILGTAEDYRRLYGSGRQPSTVMRPARGQVRGEADRAKKPKASTKKAVAKKATAKKPTAKKTVAKKSSAAEESNHRSNR